MNALKILLQLFGCSKGIVDTKRFALLCFTLRYFGLLFFALFHLVLLILVTLLCFALLSSPTLVTFHLA